MPRTSRELLPNCPHHIVHRGHNRQAIFAEAGGYQYYLDTLRIGKGEHGVKDYAYCLIQNISTWS